MNAIIEASLIGLSGVNETPLISMKWLEDLERYNRTGIQPAWRSKNALVPKGYRLDLEFVCFTNAKNLADLTGYRYVEGLARRQGDESTDAWGEHAWCVAPSGKIVDPYFEWMFPGEAIEYRA